MLADVVRRAVRGVGGLVGNLGSRVNAGAVVGVDGYLCSNQRRIFRCTNGVLLALFTSVQGPVSPVIYYSTNDGSTWAILIGGSAPVSFTARTYAPGSVSGFVDLDDFFHIVYKNWDTGFIYYIRGTPDTNRTTWSWSTPLVVWNTNTYQQFPEMVVHREGTGWVAHIVTTKIDTVANITNTTYHKVAISSGGVFTLTAGVDLFTSYPGQAQILSSLDFNHTGDGKTVAQGTPHIYIANSGGQIAPNFGIRFKKLSYSAGVWTAGPERVIDAGRAEQTAVDWIVCFFDGSRVVIVGYLYDGGGTGLARDVVIYDRDVADTTTVMWPLIDKTEPDKALAYGTATYDGGGNIYLFGVNVDEAAGNYDAVFHRWDRNSHVLGPEVVIDVAVTQGNFVAKRGAPNNKVEFYYISGAGPTTYQPKYGAIT